MIGQLHFRFVVKDIPNKGFLFYSDVLGIRTAYVGTSMLDLGSWYLLGVF